MDLGRRTTSSETRSRSAAVADDGQGRWLIPSRFVPAACALAAFFLLTAVYEAGWTQLYAQIFEHWGVESFAFPFVDMSGALAAWECARSGVDVAGGDPCDVLGRAYSYSPLWMAASGIPLGVNSTLIVGWLTDLVFLGSFALLPPARGAWAQAASVMAALSSMVAFGAERANPDILVFLLAMLVGFLALRSSAGRWAAVVLTLCTGLFLKYYSLSILILSLRERLYAFIATAAVTIILIVGFVALYLPELERGFPHIAMATFAGDAFAATNLPFGLATMIYDTYLVPGEVTSLTNPIALAFYLLMLFIGAIVCAQSLIGGRLRVALASIAPEENIFLVIGSITMVGCFFTWHNVGYRGIFLLFVLPGMLTLARGATHRSVRRLGAETSAFIVFLMWGECIRLNLKANFEGGPDAIGSQLVAIFWFIREMVWWRVAAVMTAVLVVFVANSRVVQELRDRIKLRRGRVRTTEN